jgi:putative phosphoribosyl transferase
MPANLDFNDYLFKDREDASKQLLEILPHALMQNEDWLLLTLASGAVPLSEMISSKFGVEYDLLFMAAIYAPNNDECQIAKVSELEEIVIDQNLVDSFGITLDYIYGDAERKYQNDLLTDQYQYRKSLPLTSIKDRNILLIDEGCETGLRAVCAIKSVLAHGAKKVSLATPIIAEDLFHQLELMLDDIYTNYKIKDFIEVDYYYESLEKFKKKEIKKILENSEQYVPFKGEK